MKQEIGLLYITLSVKSSIKDSIIILRIIQVITCFYGLWYSGNVLTSEPYGKCAGMLKRGMFAHITIVGNISNSTDYCRYIANEKF